MNLEDVTTLHSQAECNSFQSYTYLFISPFSSSTPSIDAHYEIMEKPFSIQRQLVATGYMSLICPQGDFRWLKPLQEGGAEEKRKAGETKSSTTLSSSPPEMGLFGVC